MEGATTGEIQEVDEVLRRDFSWVMIGTVLGLGTDALDIDRLDALLPTGPAASTTARIGAADVAAIEQATAVLRQWDYSRGGGLSRSAAVAQLQSVLPLLDTASTPAVREQLLVATARLGRVAAWASYDAGHHDDAHRLFMLALTVAQQAEHPRAADLTAYLLTEMANQALHLHRPQEALSLVQLGYGTAAGRNQPLTASAASYLASYQAWGRAALGDARACDRALGQSAEHFTHADPNTAPPWAMHLTAAELTARTDHHAVQEITAIASLRAYDRLRTLDTVLQPHTNQPDRQRGTRKDPGRTGHGLTTPSTP